MTEDKILLYASMAPTRRDATPSNSPLPLSEDSIYAQVLQLCILSSSQIFNVSLLASHFNNLIDVQSIFHTTNALSLPCEASFPFGVYLDAVDSRECLSLCLFDEIWW